MTDGHPIRSPDATRQSCAAKLRGMGISGQFIAMLGCLLREKWTTPMLVEMVSTPDGHLLGRCEGEASCQAFLGETEDLIRNIHGVAKVVGLDGALLESKTLRKQAASNSKEKISHSPDLKTAILNAIMEALEAHTTMSTQALESERS